MSFILTEEWLWKYYGSTKKGQEEDTLAWLEKWRPDSTREQREKWKKWKHLTEYCNNTPDIVERCLSMVGKEFRSELEAHKEINCLRVPVNSSAYLEALDVVQPKTILELGVGGDSAISTAIFLNYINDNGGWLISVDKNPLGMTWERYKNYVFWNFYRRDSVDFLNEMVKKERRFDLVFIDTIHSYSHTLKELERASIISNSILLDDANFEGNDFDDVPGGVKKAIEKYLEVHKKIRISYQGGCVDLLLTNI